MKNLLMMMITAITFTAPSLAQTQTISQEPQAPNIALLCL